MPIYRLKDSASKLSSLIWFTIESTSYRSAPLSSRFHFFPTFRPSKHFATSTATSSLPSSLSEPSPSATSSSCLSSTSFVNLSDGSPHSIDDCPSMLSNEELVLRMFKRCLHYETRSAFYYLQELLKRSASLSLEQWMALLNTYRHRVTTKNDVCQMNFILQQIKGQNGSIPIPALEVTLVRAAQCKMMTLVEELLKEILHQTKQPSVPVISAILNLYHKLGQPEKAIAFYESLNVTGLPSLLFHCIFMKLYAALGDLHTSERLFKELVTVSTRTRLVAPAYAWMAQLYIKDQQWEQAHAVMREMEEKNLPRVPLAYHVLVELSLAKNDLAEAVNLCYESMKEAKKPHFSYMVKSVVTCLLRLSPPQLTSAEKLIRTYKATCKQCKPNSRPPFYPYAPLLDFYVRNKALEKAIHLFNTIPGKAYLHDFTVIMMMRIFIQHHYLHEAEQFLKTCLGRGYRPGKEAPTLENWKTLPILFQKTANEGENFDCE